MAKKSKAIKLSKVYAKGEVEANGECHWAFNLSVGDVKPKGYAFGNRADAIKARVLIQKKIKSEGYQIHCMS